MLALVPLKSFEVHSQQANVDSEKAQGYGNYGWVVGDVQDPAELRSPDDVNRGSCDVSDSFFQNGGSFLP